jgi:potassium-transporting ATPase potassium-binding subunit
MDWRGWAEIVFTIALTVAVGWPLGIYMARVWARETTPLDLVLKPVEAGFYAALGIDRNKGQNWLGYAGAVLAFSAAGFALLYAMLRLQGFLPLNPQGFDGVSPHLAFNTAVSFVTNTNWQSYGGETTLSSLSQMAGLTVQNFVSAGAGLAIAAAVARAFAADRGETLGNFWVDLIRSVLYVTALALVAAGVPQSLLANITAKTLEGADQIIALFPVASQEAIKQWGTNGGGLFNVNSAHPLENPTPLTNLIEVVSLNALAFGTVTAFGRVAGARKEARALLTAMVILVGLGAAAIYSSETLTPQPAMVAAGITDAPANLEGKEARFGAAASSIWAAQTTGASNGSVNSMHGSFMPLGGGVAMFLMQLGEILPGGVGSGLYGMVVMSRAARSSSPCWRC